MQVSVIEQEKGKLKIELKNASKSFAHFIAEEVWQKGGEAAALKEHPFLVEPKLLVKGSNPKKLLLSASEVIQTNCDKLKAAYSHSKK